MGIMRFVPGTVLTTLVEQSVYPDPYYGLNNFTDTGYALPYGLVVPYLIRDTSEDDEGYTDYQILLNGINYKADIWLNGIRFGIQ